MNVPLLDLKAQYLSIKADVDAAIAEVMESQHFILGPMVDRCEKAIATVRVCAHGVGVSSGTTLLVCLMAETSGWRRGHHHALHVFATAGAIARVGATPVCRHRSGDV
jgi:dTDP-4-amino-4,6-dideoxygalactose transaminase